MSPSPSFNFKILENGNLYFYSVKNWGKDGVIFFYLAKNSSRQICVFYPKGEFWSSFGWTIINAINGAQRDGWMYA